MTIENISDRSYNHPMTSPVMQVLRPVWFAILQAFELLIFENR